MPQFIGANLAGSLFEDVYLTGAQFHDVDLTGASFRLVDLTGGKYPRSSAGQCGHQRNDREPHGQRR